MYTPVKRAGRTMPQEMFVEFSASAFAGSSGGNLVSPGRLQRFTAGKGCRIVAHCVCGIVQLRFEQLKLSCYFGLYLARHVFVQPCNTDNVVVT